MSSTVRPPQPGDGAPFTERTPRVVAARALRRRKYRDSAGRFLAEGAQAVREVLATEHPVHELFVTATAARRCAELIDAARNKGIVASFVTDKAAAVLSDTVNPQGIVAVCDLVDVPVSDAVHPDATLVAILSDIADPGNAGAILRVADAAGADAVVFAGETVDPHNGKAVRACTGSLFHLPLARVATVDEAIDCARAAGLTVIGAAGGGARTVHQASAHLKRPTAWVFGNEAHGLSTHARDRVDEMLAVPLYGKAESLNLATAAAVCLYASAFAQH
ncbi:MAG: TrmH family RNA methyltransferase [Sciscionella sp.]